MNQPSLYADADGVRIAYDDAGAGAPALLALPGWCGGRSLFAPLVPELAPRHRVMTMDWRGHGESDPATNRMGLEELVTDAEAVIRASGAEAVIPVAVAHAGWVAIELRRRLGRRIPAMVLIDWILLEPPPPFSAALDGLQAAKSWRAVRDALFAMWLGDAPPAHVTDYVRGEMASTDPAIWAAAGRMIGGAYAREGSPMQALAALADPVPVLHLFGQPHDASMDAAHRDFASRHPWFQERRVAATTHFPTMEVPRATADAIADFVAKATAPADA